MKTCFFPSPNYHHKTHFTRNAVFPNISVSRDTKLGTTHRGETGQEFQTEFILPTSGQDFNILLPKNDNFLSIH